MTELDSETLLGLGFVDVGAWVYDATGINYQLDGPDVAANDVRLNAPKALYAFVCNNQVRYIGKTARTIRQRFVGYRRPGSTQRTNRRCHQKIREALTSGTPVRILVFTPISHLRYQDFEIDLAAGLEDSLIATFDPPWNGREKGGQPLTEDAEREEAEEDPAVQGDADAELTQVSPQPPTQPVARFSIKLGETYYNTGILNVGVEASQHLGEHGDPIEIMFEDGTTSILSQINRTANRSGGVRIVGRNRLIAEWLRRRFGKEDILEGWVLDPNRILLNSGSKG